MNIYRTSRLNVCPLSQLKKICCLLSTRKMTDLNDKVQDMRISYDVSSISDQLNVKDPIKLFKLWFQEAVDNPAIQEPNAMNIATCSKDGFPSSRIVLLKGVSHEGFKFFTNYDSEKGTQMTENPRAALTFYWEPLQKQIRISGIAHKLSEEESEAYFHKRPIASQIGALASRQSTVIPNRQHSRAVEENKYIDYQYLEDVKVELTKKYEGKTIPKPKYWGGFLIKPVTVEFWCGGHGRLHDRIRFRKPNDNETIYDDVTREGDSGWVYERLSP